MKGKGKARTCRAAIYYRFKVMNIWNVSHALTPCASRSLSHRFNVTAPTHILPMFAFPHLEFPHTHNRVVKLGKILTYSSIWINLPLNRISLLNVPLEIKWKEFDERFHKSNTFFINMPAIQAIHSTHSSIPASIESASFQLMKTLSSSMKSHEITPHETMSKLAQQSFN